MEVEFVEPGQATRHFILFFVVPFDWWWSVVSTALGSGQLHPDIQTGQSG